MGEVEISKEFVESLLKTPVTEFYVKSATKDGDNAAGALVNIVVRTEGGEEVTLIHKTIPTNPHSKNWAVTAKIFWTENAFYSAIVPKIHEMIRGIDGYEYSVPVPRIYGALNNDEDDYITLEDLRPQGFVMPDKFKGLNVGQVSLIMKELGKFHAATRALLVKEGEEALKEFPYIRGNKYAEDPARTSAILTASSEFMMGVIGERKPEVAEKIRESLEKAGGVYNVFSRLANPEDKFLEVILHGDLWVNNVMLKYEDGGGEDNPTELRFIDFQLIGKDSIFVDLIYFFYCSTTPAFRKVHFDQVLKIYLDSLIASMTGLKLEIPEQLNWESFRSRMEDLRYSGFLLTFFALPFQLGMKPPFNKASEESDESHNGRAVEFTPEAMEAETAKFFKILQESFLSSPRGIERLMELSDEIIELNVM